MKQQEQQLRQHQHQSVAATAANKRDLQATGAEFALVAQQHYYQSGHGQSM